MNAEQRRRFARRLDEERARLSSTVGALAAEAELDVVEAIPQREDSAGGLSDAEAAEAAASLELEQLREVEAAIARLRDDPGRFGRCVVCGASIGARRLELVPWTQHCIKHAVATPHQAATMGRAAAPILE